MVLNENDLAKIVDKYVSQAFMLGINLKNESSRLEPAVDCSECGFDALGDSSSWKLNGS